MDTQRILKRLPQKLTIAFPIWGLFDTQGKNRTYRDLDLFVKEHIERGFNCIRLECGAGLIHNIEGVMRKPFYICDSFGGYENSCRQNGVWGDGGECDLFARLIELCVCAKKYGVYLILSSWYYLHTYWYHGKNDEVCKELFAIPYSERFMSFARFSDHILSELEKRRLDDCIAFVEIFNESNDLPEIWIEQYGAKIDISESEYRVQHERALEYLQKRHPQILFGYDCGSAWAKESMIPANMQVYNFHHYFLWDIYDKALKEKQDIFLHKLKKSDIIRTREGRIPALDGWYERIYKYNNLDINRIDELNYVLESFLNEDYGLYCQKMMEGLNNVIRITSRYKNVPIVCGEGVSYIASKSLLWEERSKKYWELLEYIIKAYKQAGLWGTVIRTCCGPEDPSWTLCKDKIKELNKIFLN